MPSEFEKIKECCGLDYATIACFKQDQGIQIHGILILTQVH